MMTKEQYIDYWVDTAQKDWIAVESMFDTKNYLHCLFWAHLTLEKLAKALWVKKMCTKEFTYAQLEKIKEIKQCLIEML